MTPVVVEVFIAFQIFNGVIHLPQGTFNGVNLALFEAF
jgi:hypothetical protein